MACWKDELVTMLRVLINDLGETPSYSDSRLQQLLVVAARYVLQDMDFDTSYTININVPNISPDPVGTTTRDDAFANFTVLKAACLSDQSLFRTKALLEGITARCGPATLSIAGHLPGFKELITQGPCAAYLVLKQQYYLGDARGVRAIMSPFTGNNFNPEDLTWMGGEDIDANYR